jgi:hypothetical protein
MPKCLWIYSPLYNYNMYCRFPNGPASMGWAHP